MIAFLKTAGAALLMLGLGLGVIILSKPGYLDAMGIRLDTAALLLIGGILANGQAGIIQALRGSRPAATAEVVAPVAALAKSESPAKPSIPVKPVEVAKPAASAAVESTNPFTAAAKDKGFAAVAAGAGLASMAGAGIATAKSAAPKDSVSETITALEQAKADVIKSMSGLDADHGHGPAHAQSHAHGHAHAPVGSHVNTTPAATITPPPPHAEHAAVEPEDGLYVVEEKVIRGRPARILSDSTVEAETDEGWMRFENLEHLNEYLDSVEEQSA